MPAPCNYVITAFHIVLSIIDISWSAVQSRTYLLYTSKYYATDWRVTMIYAVRPLKFNGSQYCQTDTYQTRNCLSGAFNVPQSCRSTLLSSINDNYNLMKNLAEYMQVTSLHCKYDIRLPYIMHTLYHPHDFWHNSLIWLLEWFYVW